MQFFKLYISILLMILLFAACNRERNETMLLRLQQLDNALDDNPEAIKDSLQQIDPVDLSRSNKAYYNLLKIITDDKTYFDFTSDSLISETEKQLHRYKKGSDLHIRALVYQGIVRYRMGITDSTVFLPLKKTEQLYANLKQPNPKIEYMMYYYLGKLLEENNNDKQATDYYMKSLQTAKNEKNSLHIFDCMMALAWNQLIIEDSVKVNIYLKQLEEFPNKNIDQTYRLLNLQSTFFHTQNRYEEAMEMNKKRIGLAPQVKEKPEMFRLYYSISDEYLSLNQPDSALLYIDKSITNITDSSYIFNYLLYEKAAQISEAQNNYIAANDYRKKSMDFRDKSIKQEKSTTILELEKKYNHAEAENRALKAQVAARTMYGVAIILFVVLVLIIIIWRRYLKIAQLENESAKTNLLLLQQQSEEKRKIISIVLPYLNLHASVHSKLSDFTNITRAKDSKLADRFDNLLKNNRVKFNETTQNVFTDDFISDALGFSRGLEVLNSSDRLLLFMLSIDVENEYIAALLNTTPVNLKSRKSYLKKKIQNQADCFDNIEALLSLF